MNLPDNQANFEVSFLPLGSAEERQAAAAEWAAYKQAAGQVEARERGAALVVSSRDESPQALLDIIEDKNVVVTIPFAPWVTHSVVKILKLHPDAKSYDLFRDYFEPDET